MDTKNRTLATEFILLGFSNDSTINTALFVLFLVIYVVAVNGNVLIIYIILNHPPLHIPMYFFLCILSFMDLCITSTVVPKLLSDLVYFPGSISFIACTIQFYTILLMGGTECLLLAIMAYDRYVAICYPLHYPVLMRWSVCYRLTAVMWIITFMIFIVPPLMMPIALCNPNKINHFMCEVLAVIQLACNSNLLGEIVMVITCFVALFLPFVFILVSYVCIISSVLKIHSTGRSKAFSTCTSHVTVVVLFYGTAIVIYFGPSSQYLKKQGKYVSLFSNIICPTLNPLIYSLNNKEVKLIHRKILFNNCHNVQD